MYGVAALLVSVCGAVASCAQDRAAEPAPTSYDAVAPIFAQRCAECHTGVAPAGGWSAASFLGAIACVGPGAVTPAAAPSDTSAPLLRALDTNTHAGRTSASERQTLTAWVRSGAPGTPGPVHAGGFADPRSADFHGKVLRDARWAPMLDGQNDGACGRCHDGAPARPRGVTFAAPGAPACTSCHTQPGGAQACTTCHGAGQNPAPPRDACFFPADTARAGAHAKHVAQGLACSTCHPTPSGNVVSGLHADGVVEVVFDTARVSPEASYDRASGTCAVSCHDQGGARPRPAWNEPGPMKCGDCHGAPPARHFPGACTTCHHEANADGTKLSGGPLHMNGKIDLGDGRGTCGACHGTTGDPWPTTGAHATHRAPDVTLPVTCTTCHPVPDTLTAPGHMNGHVDVVLGGRAADRDVIPTYADGACSVACHGARMRDQILPLPAWKDTSGAATTCQGCHRSPPTQHTPSTGCDRSTCHGGEIARDGTGAVHVTLDGKSHHIDGIFDHVR